MAGSVALSYVAVLIAVLAFGCVRGGSESGLRASRARRGVGGGVG
jgi:uncharacterized spore protein YtfJ